MILCVCAGSCHFWAKEKIRIFVSILTVASIMDVSDNIFLFVPTLSRRYTED